MIGKRLDPLIVRNVPNVRPNTGGRGSLWPWSRSWRGQTEALRNKSKLGGPAFKAVPAYDAEN